MQLWVGLGNPGGKYALQRHNVGFMAADIIAAVHDFGPWQKKFRGLGPEFRRVRIGIGHPGPGRKDLVTPHVLGNYAKSEMEPLSDLLAAIAAEAEWLADGDDARFMSEVALRLQSE